MPKLKQKLIKKQKNKLRNIISNNESLSYEVKRAQSIIMIDKGNDVNEIFELTGYCRSQVFEIRKNYLNCGIKALYNQHKKNPKELLTNKQKDKIIKVLKTKTPSNFGYDNDHWTTKILGDFIKRYYNVDYQSRTSYYLIFKQAKFSYHKPGREYEKHNEQEIKAWKKETKPIIKKAWKDPNTIILTEDEMILSTQTTFQKIWLPQGEYPKIKIATEKENRSLYGFLNIKAGIEHAFKTTWQNMYITVGVLKKLRKIYPNEKLLIIWDRAGWHKGSETQKFIKADKLIKTIYFPRAAPEENPQEHVWKNGRDKTSHNEFIKDIDKATDQFVKYLNTTKFNYSLLGFKSDFRM